MDTLKYLAMKRLSLTLTLISALIILNACSEASDVQTNLLNDNSESTMNLQIYEISPEEVNEKLQNNENFHLIDVRTTEERNEAHIKGDTDFINSVDIESGLIKFENYDKNDEIIVYCRSGNRSARVFKIMEALGFTNVKSMAGGINEWKILGYNTCSELNNTC